jgi:hypothetical protein
VSIPAHSAALNLTVQTYVDRIDLGVTACLEAVPDAAKLRDDIQAGWRELRSAAIGACTPNVSAATSVANAIEASNDSGASNGAAAA